MAVVLGILTLLLLLLLLPVRVTAKAATGQEPTATLHYLFFSVLLYPRPERPAPKQPEKKKQPKEKGEQPKRDLKPLLMQLLSRFERLSRPVQRLLRRTGLARFFLRLVVVGEDAAATALRFGRANAAVYSAVAVLDRIFALRVRQIEIIPGFTAEREEYSFSGEARVVPLAALIAALQLGFWALVALIQSAGASKDTKATNENRRVKPGGRKEECYGNQASHQ